MKISKTQLVSESKALTFMQGTCKLGPYKKSGFVFRCTDKITQLVNSKYNAQPSCKARACWGLVFPSKDRVTP